MQEGAAAALRNISANAANSVLLAEKGALIVLLRSHSAALQEGAGSEWAMTCNSNIFSRGPVLLQRSLRCCHRARSACTNARLRRSATSAQTRTSASRDAAAGRRDTPPLDETLLATPEVAVQQIAASTLATLNKRNAVSAPIASGGAIPLPASACDIFSTGRPVLRDVYAVQHHRERRHFVRGAGAGATMLAIGHQRPTRRARPCDWTAPDTPETQITSRGAQPHGVQSILRVQVHNARARVRRHPKSPSSAAAAPAPMSF